MDIANLTLVVFLAGGTILVYILFRHRLNPSRAGFVLRESGPFFEGPAQYTRQIRGVRLYQVNPLQNDTETDVDIIAIHGLDTRSPDTWMWANPSDPKQLRVNWLQDPNMLPSRVRGARIFTCDWPGDIFETSNLAQKTFEELARLLLASIKQRPLVANYRAGREGQPIIFIASCLGGIILMKTLMLANQEYFPLRAATRGIIFLSTPFRGTSFQDVAKWAEPGLTACAWFRGKKVTKLLGSVKGSNSDLEELVRSFTDLCKDPRYDYQVFTFYEKGYTSLYSKVFPWLPDRFLPAQQLLVDASSATLDIVSDPLPLNRRHVMMNKFYGPEDPDYQEVAKKIEEFIRRTREGSALERADAWIREKYYTADRLKIERLSRETLSMEQCYINLAIVEQSGKYTDSINGKSQERSEGDVELQSSPFSLRARLNVEIPGRETQVELPAIFNPRKRPDGHTTQPRRLWIQGRAGVGKTTLCKKIVHRFKNGEMWQELFDRLLWLPLRNLKQRTGRGRYGLTELFSDEYFPWHEEHRDLADALQRACNKPDGGRSLFILDGLDEIWQELSPDDDMKIFVGHLLRQPNVIVTSRQSVVPCVDQFDLELETIGFYPHQVTEYIHKVEPAKARHIQAFLESRPLVRDLVRIPIQLDAVCYAWKDVYASAPETMTDLYMAIERGLGQKDISRLEKRVGSRNTHENDTLYPNEVEYLTKDETEVIAGLAFTGLYNDVVVFDAKCRDSVSKNFAQGGTTIDDTLRRLSYLRTSDPSASGHSQTYHFLHLTLQEYFAARYFFQKWTAGAMLKCLDLYNVKVNDRSPISFLQRHKYSARYDIFWRFVAGLLDAPVSDQENKQRCFFETIQQEPLDRLGLAHQRLVMHCLNETRHSSHFPRRKFERHLSKWLIFQCKRLREWDLHIERPVTLASEIEFPEEAIVDVLQSEQDEVRTVTILSLRPRREISHKIAEIVIPWLEGDKSEMLTSSILHLFESSRHPLPESVLNAIVTLFDNQDQGIRRAAINALRSQSNVSEETLNRIAGQLEDQARGVRRAAVNALNGHSSLTEGTLNQIVERLGKRDPSIRRAAINALRGQWSLPEATLNQIAACLEDEDRDVRRATINALTGRSNLPEGTLSQIAALLECPHQYVRSAAIDAIKGQLYLPDIILSQIAAMLYNQNPSIRRAAINTIRDQSNLPEGTLHKIAALLDCQRQYVRSATIYAVTGQPNLPDKILSRIAAGLKDTHIRKAAIDALRGQSNLPEEILSQIAALLEDQDPHVRNAAIEVLKGQSDLPAGTLHQIAKLLECQRQYVRRATINAMTGHSNLPDKILSQIAAGLEDTHIRKAAIDALRGQSNLPEKILSQIVERLDKQDPHIRKAAINALRCQSSLPEEILSQIVKRLDKQDPQIRSAAIYAVTGQPNLPDKIVSQIAAGLEDTHIRKAAIDALRCQSNLPEGILDQIATLLEDQDPHIRNAAIEVLKGQSNLPAGTLSQISARLDNPEPHVRRAAIDALIDHSSLPEETLNQIVERLGEQDPSIRRAAINTIRGQSNLPEGTLHKIAALLDCQRQYVRSATIYAVTGHSNLPDKILSQIATGLEDTHIRKAAIDALRGQSNLPEGILDRIATLLECQRKYIRSTASNVLKAQPNLPAGTLSQISARLDNPEPHVRRAAIDVLTDHSSLPEKILSQTAALLKDQDTNVKNAIIKVLRGQSNLREGTLNQIVALLEDQRQCVRSAAIDVLTGPAYLPDETLHLLVAQLDNQDSNVRRAVITALTAQSILPEGILDQIAVRLADRRLIEIDSFAVQLMSMLMQCQGLHSRCLAGANATKIFPLLLRQSFHHHVAWYIHDAKSCLQTNNHFGSVALLHGQNKLERAIEQARREAAIPAIAVSHEVKGPMDDPMLKWLWRGQKRL